MHKDDLLTTIADTAYNVGFGAKIHFASYDMVAKIPGLINFIAIAVGILALFVDVFSLKVISATLYISAYNNDKQKYADIGVNLTAIFNQLKQLYFEVKNCSETDLAKYKTEYQKLEAEYNRITSYNQIMFSNWYAHYKFFCQQEINWLNEQKKFKLFSDKIPRLVSLIIVITIITIAINNCELLTLICSFIN